jgi:hypothetical protein
MSTTTTAVQVAPPLVGESIELGHLDPGVSSGRQLGPDSNADSPHVSAGDNEGDEPPADALTEAERWNRPVKNIGRLAFAFMSFAIAGMNDAAVGVGNSASLRRPFL